MVLRTDFLGPAAMEFFLSVYAVKQGVEDVDTFVLKIDPLILLRHRSKSTR